jgi:mono/diheme cytochrome c family protein
VAPSLVNGIWFFGDGSLKAISKTIADGVPKPRNYSDPMPPRGGAPLTDADVAAVSAYVWAINQQRSN